MIKIEDFEIKIGHFPDGTLSLGSRFNDWEKIFEEVGRENIVVRWYYDNEEELIALIYLTKHLKSNGVQSIRLFMPYIPNARMDRVKNIESDVFTLKYFAEIINSLHFERVFVLDPHSSVSEALINNVEVLELSCLTDDVIGRIPSDNLTVFFPDEGACKRYLSTIVMPYTFGSKRRAWDTGEIQGLDIVGGVENIKDCDVLIIDDICSRGGTFYHSAKKLKELGARKIYLYVTHCENTILEGELLNSGLIERVYTSSDIFTKTHKDVEVLEL